MADVRVLLQEQDDALYRLERIVINFKKIGKSQFTDQRVHSRMTELQELMREIRKRHAKLTVHADEDTRKTHSYFTTSKFMQCIDRYDEDLVFLEGLLTPASPDAVSPTPTPTVLKPPVKLPPIELPKFNGSLRDWEVFRDRFTTLILDNRTLADSDRMQYLHSAVSHTAADAIRHIPLTTDNFKLAWEVLTNQFEDKRRLVFHHIQELLSLPSVKPKSSSSIRLLRDTFKLSRESLRKLGRPVHHWDDFIVYLVTQRLDWASKEVWELSISSNTDIPTVSALDDFLQARIRVVESMFPTGDTLSGGTTVSKSAPSRVASHATSTTSTECALCHESRHSVRDCANFRDATTDRRIELLTTHRYCLNCLAASHLADACPSIHRCRRCGQKHHTVIHKDDVPVAPAPTPINTCLASFNPTVLLATATVKVTSPSGRSASIRALLDQGSEATLISEGLAQLLRLPRLRQTNCVQGIGGAPTISQFTTEIGIGRPSDRTSFRTLPAVVLRTLTKFRPQRLPSVQSWAHLTNLVLADTNMCGGAPVDLILGADVYGSLLCDGLRQGRPDEPVAQNTVFGWVISGPTSTSVSPHTITTHSTTLTRLDEDLRRFWELDDLPAVSPLTPEERRCDQHFAQTHSRHPDGRYIVRLPFKTQPPIDFGDTRSSAAAHLRRTETRLHRDPSKAAAYVDFMTEYHSLHHMRRAPSVTTSSTYYIPHHAVYREEGQTSKIRVVFDASHVPAGGTSLNQVLSAGPKLQTDLPAILIRWRQFRHVCTADVSKMYRQICIDPRDLDYQRILWRDHPSLPVHDFQLLTVTYGTTSAPYLALKVLQQLMVDEGEPFPLATVVLRQQTYVDDCLFGAHTIDQVMETRTQLVALLQKGGFHLHKWASNVQDLLSPQADGSTERTIQSDSHHKVLGVVWAPRSDHLLFRFAPTSESPTTKRTVVSIVARLFDPLGWLTPVTVSAKILIQRLWLSNCDWDTPLAGDLRDAWLRIWHDFLSIATITIPRWSGFHPDHAIQLHGFADASGKAYAAAVYLRVTPPSGAPLITLIAAKSRVAPVKTVSIPRLELCAAGLLSRLVAFIRQSLSVPSVPAFYWSDSQVVLAWLARPPTHWATFVANRVAVIQEECTHGHWRHVPTHDNPADCASRGISVGDLRSHRLWWTGPAWLLSDESHWPVAPSSPPPPATFEEQRTVISAVCKVDASWTLPHKFSSWAKLLRVTALLFRCTHRLRRRDPAQDNYADHLQCARHHWLRVIQRDLFPSELRQLSGSLEIDRHSPLVSLNPYLDDSGLIRVRGRLRNSQLPEMEKYPIILGSHPLVKLLISSVHLQLMHGNPTLVLAKLRQDYWLLRPRPLIRAVIYECVTCCRQSAKTSTQLMSDLPDYRITRSARAFIHTGVDYAGPIILKARSGRTRTTYKAYIAVFVCMATKAVHLELVTDYSASAFLAALHRFSSRRGTPSHLYSDNGTTFKGADRALRAPYIPFSRQPPLRTAFDDQGIKWHFLPPAAPHFGGLWEAAVKSLKYHLRRSVGTHTLSYEEMSTLLCRIEGCLNSRPLARLSDNLDDYECLTPGHFLIGTSLTSLPEPSVLDIAENRLSRWQLVQHLHEQVWHAWQRDYLHTLQQRPKWRQQQRLAKCGEIVLLKEAGLPPSHWPLGRIITCHPGDDGLVRVVTVKTSTSTFTRPITKLCFLPIPLNDSTEEDSTVTEPETADGSAGAPSRPASLTSLFTAGGGPSGHSGSVSNP